MITNRLLMPAISLLLLLSMSACQPDQQLSKLSDDATILTFGDSLTAGVGASSGMEYPTQLQSLITQRVVNSGISGEKTEGGMKRLQRELEKHQPELVILCLGGNDFLRKIPKQETEQNLLSMMQTIQTYGAQVVLVAVPEPGIFLSDSELYSSVAEQSKVALMDSVLSDLLADKSLKSDTIHLNDRGYQMLAAEVYQFLIDTGAIEYKRP